MTDLSSHQILLDDSPRGDMELNQKNNKLLIEPSSNLNMSLSTLPSSIQNEIISSLNQKVFEVNNPESTMLLNNSENITLENPCNLSSSFILNKSYQSESLNFKEILELFGCAISEEQAWAVLNQCLSELKFLLNNNIDLLYLNQDSIDINILNFIKDGSILFGFKLKSTSESPIKSNMKQSFTPNYIMQLNENKNLESWSSNSSQSSERNDLEAMILKSVAYLIFDALDYGNSNQNEPDLKNTLQNLLLQMSGYYKEFTSAKLEYDEGYEQEEEDIVSLEKALEVCHNHVSEADYHYKAVCRGLYAQAYELKAFLAKIEDSKKILEKSGQNPSEYSFEILNTTDWTKLWMQVIHELRNGVKLRKVSESQCIMRRHIEFELTPFEILLDQIRAKKYSLKKLGPSVMPEKRKDARDIILEFIRSRPPLKKSTQRKLKPRNIKLNLHDQLMISIRTFSIPLKKVPEKETDSLNQDGSEEKVTKKRLKVDKNLLKNKFSSSDDDDSDIDYDELQNSSIFFQSDQYLSQSSYVPDLTDSLVNTSFQQKKSIKAPESLKSPLAEWSDPVENWRALVTEDILTETKNRFEGRSPSLRNLERRHTMNLADTISNNLASLNIFAGLTSSEKTKLNSERKHKVSVDIKKSKSKNPEYLKSGPGHADFGFVSAEDLIKKITSVDISLTFDELCHIRKVLTKNDLDYLLFDQQLYLEVSKGKICFSCRKTRFNWLNWGCKCNVCQQRICKKCLKSVLLNNGQLAQVPLSKLCPKKFADAIIDNTDSESRNSNSSICSQTTNEEDSDQMASSNEKLESASTVSTDNVVISKSRSLTESQLLNICVDCYQLMISVKVDQSNEDELSDSNDKIQSDNNLNMNDVQRKSVNKDLAKILNKNNMSSPYMLTGSKSSSIGLNSPDTPITMNSLIHIKNINQSSPFQNVNFTGNKNHSTPTPQAKPNVDDTLELDDFEQEKINSNYIQNSQNGAGLTLDLNPDSL